MKIGYNEATAMKRSNLEKDLILAEKYGYDYIEIRLDMLDEYLRYQSIDDLVRFFEKSHIKPYAFNAIEEINFCNEARINEIEDRLHRVCSIAQKINNPYIIAVPSFRYNLINSKSQEEILHNSVEILNKMADITEKYGVSVAFEPVGFVGCAVRSIEDAWKIVEKADRKSIGMVIDAFNVYVNDALKDIKALDNVPADKIFVFHINDCKDGIPLTSIELKHRVWPGEGVIPLDQLLHSLYKKQYDKIISIELFNEQYWDMKPEDVFRIGKQNTEQQIIQYYK